MSSSYTRVMELLDALLASGVPAALIEELREAIDDALNESAGDGLGY